MKVKYTLSKTSKTEDQKNSPVIWESLKEFWHQNWKEHNYHQEILQRNRWTKESNPITVQTTTKPQECPIEEKGYTKQLQEYVLNNAGLECKQSPNEKIQASYME